ncbi:MAG TPA: alkaline phosphatase family protein [Solirubrobacteraceae bacterium]|nr:alkaline phosphatase family protein [Solirubrobacteraceae bacterium]
MHRPSLQLHVHPSSPRRGRRRRAIAALSVLALVALVAATVLAPGAGASTGAAVNRHPGKHKHTGARKPPDGLGVRPGAIKHVWLIILENKSYDATFTGLNKNTYLWQTLPHQGALLKNYYGTGHDSEDNYITLASGQAPQPDVQNDCPYYDKLSGHIDRRGGSLKRDRNYGQIVSAAGQNAAAGQNGCVYPRSVKTLFNQLSANHISWKGYAQDLASPNPPGDPPHSVGARYCGAPFVKPGPTASPNFPNPGSANATDQYVPKHFPFPWFQSILKSGDCNARHIADVFSPRNGLYHDLQHKRTTPAFSWITPDNCNDGHDAVCAGNNLSGGFRNPTTPRAPVNYTGGLYAADLFLEHVIGEIERSPAFRDGGLIDVTFDEAFPPFTYTNDSFANSTIVAPTAKTSIADDSAGETLFGKAVHYEPTGPNLPLAKSAAGQELYPGPGNNLFIDRPSNCVAQTVPKQPKGTCLLGGANHVPGPRTDSAATAVAGATAIADPAVTIIDRGRAVSGTGIPPGAFVGKVTNSFVNATEPSGAGGFVVTGSFALVNSSGQPLATTGPVSGVTLGAETPQTDPLYDATHATTGGGDTGSVLISPYINPGSVSRRFYNHYGWLRTMEDLFRVSRHSKGIDGKGHLGYAAQPGLAPFGRDVFTDPSGKHPPKKRG